MSPQYSQMLSYELDKSLWSLPEDLPYLELGCILLFILIGFTFLLFSCKSIRLVLYVSLTPSSLYRLHSLTLNVSPISSFSLPLWVVGVFHLLLPVSLFCQSWLSDEFFLPHNCTQYRNRHCISYLTSPCLYLRMITSSSSTSFPCVSLLKSNHYLVCVSSFPLLQQLLLKTRNLITPSLFKSR